MLTKGVGGLRIGPRLGLGFGVVLLLLVATVGLALVCFQRVGLANQQLVHEDWKKAEAAAELNALTRANGRRTMELFFVTADAARSAQVRERIRDNRAKIDTHLATLDRLVKSREGMGLLGELKQARAAYVRSFTQVDNLLAQSRRDEAAAELMGTTLPAMDTLQASVEAMTRFQSARVEEAGAAVQAQIDQTKQALLWAAALALLAGAGLALWLARSVTVPLARAVEVARQVASGDLRADVRIDRHDETGELLQALQSMSQGLSQLVVRVRSGSDALATAAGEISAGNDDLSQRTEEQAANLQQTAASMEQLSSTVRTNAQAAEEAARLAQLTSDIAARGGEAVQEVVRTMDDIGASSKRIEDIVGVIDGIAFQTNILALNAAVEAARAGEQGRGFAVVAGEVRGLAQRSARAASEIKHLIADSTQRVGLGSQRVNEAGSTMRDVVERVARVNQLISGMTHATREQTLGIDQVSTAVTQLDQVTQQNAALVEQGAAAAQGLHHQASRLVDAVGCFRLAA
jgi:methyl-accepting chemotaxis protein